MNIPFQRSIYSGAMLLAPAIVLPVFLFFKRGRERMPDRLGFWDLETEKSLWMHGASLGEMTGLANIAREFSRLAPDLPIVASCTSPTAIPKAQEFAVASRLLPFDHSLYFGSCVRQINPQAYIFSETEIWPNLIAFLKNRNIPSYLVNGRLSDSAFRRYKIFGSIIGETLRQISHIFVSSEQAAHRFIELGAAGSAISIVSNTKYDSPESFSVNITSSHDSLLFKDELPVVALASIRPGEEDQIFKAIKSLEETGTMLQYIIAPRHAEKFSFFENRLKHFGFDYLRRSQQQQQPSSKRFILLDTIGELSTLLTQAKLAFTGGTFADYGGHNPLEAAACGVVPVVGMFSSKIQDIVETLEKAGAVLLARDADQIRTILRDLSQGTLNTTEIGSRAKQVADSFKGGSEIIVSRIMKDIYR